MQKNTTDLRNFRISKLSTPEYSHLWLLLYWPVYGLLFAFVERGYRPPDGYIVMHCALDELIPFCELFLVPYLFWFVYLAGSVVYTLFLDVDSFKKEMKFIILTYSATLLIYFICPTCQNLRPEVFARDNILTRFIGGFYAFDTNTNVCPSLHVIGSFAALFGLWNAPRFNSRPWRAASVIACALICLSTVFMKQHSVLDVIAALPLCLIGYIFTFRMSGHARRVNTAGHKTQKVWL